jgi:hypothetical protein
MTRLFSRGRTFVRPFLFPVSVILVGFAWILTGRIEADAFRYAPPSTDMDRLMYPFAFQGGSYQAGYTFGSFDPRFDTRDAQILLGWDTGNAIPPDRSPSRYLLRRLRITLTVADDINGGFRFQYDPTQDSVWTYATNHVRYTPDTDAGRPVELAGAAFRGGFNAATFTETSSFGPLGPFNGSNISIGTRNAHAALFDTNGVLVDISNNVGQTNATFTGQVFEVRPWAVGVTDDVPPGAWVPSGTRFVFDVDLSDPLVAGYVQQGLRAGRLRFFVTSLHPAAQSGSGGSGQYPVWDLRETLVGTPPAIELEGTVVSDVDTDADGLPDDWERFYFGSLARTGSEDPDQDGVDNAHEWGAGTDPSIAASRLELVAVRRVAGATVARFPIAASRSYRMEVSTDLQTWRQASGVLTYPETGVGEWLEQDATVPPVEPAARFYRVVSVE